MDNFGEKKAKPLALIIILAVLPVLDYFALSYIYEYLYADVAYVTFDAILNYVIAAMNFAIPYLCAAAAITATLYYRTGARRAVIIGAFISRLSQYLFGVLIKDIFYTDYRPIILSYLGVSLLNYLLFDALVFTAVIAAATVIKNRALYINPDPSAGSAGKRKSIKAIEIREVKKAQKEKKKREPLDAAFIAAAAIMFAAGFINEAIYTGQFVWSLMYEYYSSITPNELASVISAYLWLAVRAAAGYAVMRLSARFLADWGSSASKIVPVPPNSVKDSENK